ncbi:hypothetical protein ACFWD7_57840 [Streptomyces mirabilis]|uniref:hypothetical protein n=1 Tax=Streptomyces mirabilis TaxID=68239 RepID=UPI00368AD8AF
MRYQTFATNHQRGQIAHLDARHRKHARVEPKIRDQKASGIGLLPSRELEVNAAWLTATTLAADLRCWFQLLALTASSPRSPRRPCDTASSTSPPASCADSANAV